MKTQEQEDRELLRLYHSCKYDTAIELGGRTITTQSLLEAQARISFKEGVEAGRKEHEQELKIADERWQQAEKELATLKDEYPHSI